MIIVTGGMHRSGTTWLYNVLRTLYPNYKSYFAESFPIDLNTNSIIKSHEWNDCFKNTKVIRIVRDIRSVAASMLEFIPLRNYYNLNNNNIVNYLHNIVYTESENWIEGILLKYEDSKVENITKIIKFLDIEVDVIEVLNTVENIKHPSYGRDLKTEFWHNHITNSDYKNLPQSVTKYIEDDFHWWLKKYGYI